MIVIPRVLDDIDDVIRCIDGNIYSTDPDFKDMHLMDKFDWVDRMDPDEGYSKNDQLIGLIYKDGEESFYIIPYSDSDHISIIDLPGYLAQGWRAVICAWR